MNEATKGLKIRRIPLNDNDRELVNCPSIDSLLPIEFANGSTVTSTAVDCPACGKTLSGQNIHGRYSARYRDAVIIEAIAICSTCNLGTRTTMKIRDDGSHAFLTAAGAWREAGSYFAKKKRCRKATTILIGCIAASIIYGCGGGVFAATPWIIAALGWDYIRRNENT